MARWIKPLLASAALALLAHLLLLQYLGDQWLARTSVLSSMADPMLTRLITQPGAHTDAPNAPLIPISIKKVPKALQNRAQAAIKNIAPSISENLTTTLPVVTETAAMPTAIATVTDTQAVSALQNLPPESTMVTAAVTASPTATVSIAVAAPSTTASTALDVGDWPGDTRLSYKLGGYMRGELFGSGTVQWTRDAQNAEKYQVRIAINIGGFANVSLTSQGRVSAATLLPDAYEEQMPNGRRHLKLDASEVVLMDGRRYARPDDVQDTASQFVELGHRFNTGRAQLVEGGNVSVWLARPGGLDEWVYDIQAPETLYLPIMGAVQVYHLKPRALARPRGTITAEMWFAPSLQNLPVRIRITLNPETFVDLALDKIEQR